MPGSRLTLAQFCDGLFNIRLALLVSLLVGQSMQRHSSGHPARRCATGFSNSQVVTADKLGECLNHGMHFVNGSLSRTNAKGLPSLGSTVGCSHGNTKTLPQSRRFQGFSQQVTPFLGTCPEARNLDTLILSPKMLDRRVRLCRAEQRLRPLQPARLALGTVEAFQPKFQNSGSFFATVLV